MKRITWLVGPPGAGKSTFASNNLHGFNRVAELNRMMFPILKNTHINKGILTANNQLVQLIRKLELRKENMAEQPLLIVAGIISSEILFPLSQNEEVWLLLPKMENWKRQFEMRPLDNDNSKDYFENYSDYAFSEKAYYEFASWKDRGFPLKLVDFSHDISLLGKRHYG